MADAVRRQSLRTGTLRAKTITDLNETPLGASNPADYFEIFDDFFVFNGPADFNDAAVQGDAYSVTGDAATAAIDDAAGGVLSLNTAVGTDNHEGYVESASEVVLFAANKPVTLEARVKLTEAATDAANIIVGLSDTIGADFLLDNGAGPAASYDGAVFFKVDGGTVWQAETSNATTQNTDTDVGAFTSATWTKLRFRWDGIGYVYFYVDDAPKGRLALTATGLAEMHFIAGVKNGSANAEDLLIDYVRISGKR